MHKDAIVFLSYAHKDESIVTDIYHVLKKARYLPWIDKFDIKPGEDWERAIKIAIKKSFVFLAVISANSYARRGVLQKEILMALDNWESLLPDDVYIIPVRIDNSPLPERLARFQAVDWFSPNGINMLMIAIEYALSRTKN